MHAASFALGTRFLRTAALLACCARPLPAQQESPPPQPVVDSGSPDLLFRSTVRRVVLDVVVTGADEKPVRGLSRGNFSIKEDGQPQQVLSFDAHEFDEIPNPLPQLPSLPSNTWVNVPAVPEKGPLYVILYDMVNMETDNQGWARKQLLRFISDKPPGARFAIFVFSDGLKLVQGFTADRNQLFAAMDPRSPRPHVPKIFMYGDNYGKGAVGPIVAAFTEIAHFLEGLPERKNLIWITGSIPTTILPTANLNPNVEAVSYGDDVKQAINAMERSQIAVYPVDVRGVVITHVSARPQGGPGGSAMTISSDSPAVNASYSTERDIATATGGRAFYSTNDVSAALAEATEAGANYYTLTYAPSNHNYNGRLRNIHVDLLTHDLAKHGYRLAYRRSFYADDANSAAPSATAQLGKAQREAPPADGAAANGAAANGPAAPSPSAPGKSDDSLMINLRHGAPVAHQLFFGAHVHVVGAAAPAKPEQMSLLAQQQDLSRGRSKNRPAKAKSLPPVPLQTYAIEYTISTQQLKATLPAPGTLPFHLEVAAAVFDADGQMLISRLQRTRQAASSGLSDGADSAAPPASGEPSPPNFLRFQQQIEAPANAASIRMAVRDISTDRVGAMEVALPLAPEPQTQATAPPQPLSADSISASQRRN